MSLLAIGHVSQINFVHLVKLICMTLCAQFLLKMVEFQSKLVQFCLMSSIFSTKLVVVTVACLLWLWLMICAVALTRIWGTMTSQECANIFSYALSSVSWRAFQRQVVGAAEERKGSLLKWSMKSFVIVAFLKKHLWPAVMFVAPGIIRVALIFQVRCSRQKVYSGCVTSVSCMGEFVWIPSPNVMRVYMYSVCMHQIHCTCIHVLQSGTCMCYSISIHFSFNTYSISFQWMYTFHSIPIFSTSV